MQHNNSIFESLFGRNISDAETNTFLKEMTEEYPYFSPAQFYLLQQTAKDSALFNKQVLKTNLFFNNPLWLNFQTNHVDQAEEITEPVTRTVEPTNQEIVTPPESLEIREFISSTAIEQAIDSPVQEPEFPAVSLVDSALHLAEESANDTDKPEESADELQPMNISLKMPDEKTNAGEEMLFEPMHLVDYFASQGIKLSEEVQTADKLGKQLKSFTEWLKTMKKIHLPETEALPVENDENIQILAENSNAEADVITESMADVFAKQGKTGKAAELYLKLSLLNPAKSTYFAAKIDNLKGI